MIKQNILSDTQIELPEICLGTMTFGQQNTLPQAFQQLHYALEQGVNFWDTAEMYPIATKAETQGATEKIIGAWFNQYGGRDQVFLASKITGPSFSGGHIRDGRTRFNQAHISKALDDSLTRLQTDYIDLYQLHWPERSSNFFGHLGYTQDMAKSSIADLTSFEETLSALQKEIEKGRIRYIGLSNETPWGTMKFLQTAEKMGLRRFVTIQNPYSLLNRTFENGLAEISHQENIGLLAYSPLAFGMLTGKYRNQAQPQDGRLTLFPQFTRYQKPEAETAIEKYYALAQKHGLTLTQLALAFIKQQFFVTSTIIGATNLDQLKANIAAFSVHLNDEILQEINAIHQQHPNPTP